MSCEPENKTGIVFKYKLATFPHTWDQELPRDASILHVGVSTHGPAMWVWFNPDNIYLKKDVRHFRLVYTGEEFNDAHHAHVATFESEELMYHLFEYWD